MFELLTVAARKIGKAGAMPVESVANKGYTLVRRPEGDGSRGMPRCVNHLECEPGIGFQTYDFAVVQFFIVRYRDGLS